jgi:competence protein ComEC
MIVTGDGRHLAMRLPSGELAILRGRAGDYVRDMLQETSGAETEFVELQDIPTASCSSDLCSADLVKEDRRWRVLATRSSRLVDFGPLAKACAEADIVVSDRRLPRTCTPKWLKADRAFLKKSGGLSITFGERPGVSTVADRVGRHPWSG